MAVSLKNLEKKIESNAKAAWHENNLIMLKIRNEKLYKKKYGTFEKYLEDRWNVGKQRGHRLMNSAEFMQLLEKNPVEKVAKKGKIGDFSEPILPKNEGQCRPLLEKLENNGERIKVWAEVVGTGEKINAELVQTKVDEFLESGEVVPDIEYVEAEIVIGKKQRKKEKKKQLLKSVNIKEVTTEPKRIPKPGEWWILGRHKLYCGDTSSQDFIDKLPECALSFADPPYNADAADWDNDFNWEHDYLIDKADIVIVTPGIVSIFDFAKTTEMPYLWSISCIISNGMTRGAIGFGNWIYAAVFSNGSIFKNAQDAMTISIKTSESKETTHKGRKPLSFLALLFDKFTDEGNTIIDPFLGSGQSLLVCEKTNRVCIGGEISPEFCAEIINRWEGLTGEEAHADSI
jgi:DNA modification methylase